MKKWLLITVFLVLAVLIYLQREPNELNISNKTIKSPLNLPSPQKQIISPAQVNPIRSAQTPPQVQTIKTKAPILKYFLDEGLAVIQGDIAVGVPVTDGETESGYVKAPIILPWTRREIAYYIQPQVPHPERIEQALAFFSNTAIHFIPLTNQADALVFEPSQGICKSYVGKIGGKQPIWISQGCGPTEIAHELMHALGFIHEQNRTDREKYIEVFPDKIDPAYIENFEILPEHMMRISGKSEFDFQSLMIYPPNMFAKSGQSTMQARNKDQEIRPSETLSARDIERINSVFGDLPPAPEP